MSNIINVNFIKDKNKMSDEIKLEDGITKEVKKTTFFRSPIPMYIPSLNCYLLANTPL